MNYASPGRRFLGFILDFVVLGAVTALLLPILGVSLADLADGNAPGRLEIAALVVSAVYQIGFIVWRGQTPGKMAVRIRVLDEETAALPALSGATVRWLIPAAAQLVPTVGGIPLAIFIVYGWLLFDPKRQGVHDKAARTVVVDLLLPVGAPHDATPPGPVED